MSWLEGTRIYRVSDIRHVYFLVISKLVVPASKKIIKERKYIKRNVSLTIIKKDL
jgi:hypothetical protein